MIQLLTRQHILVAGTALLGAFVVTDTSTASATSAGAASPSADRQPLVCRGPFSMSADKVGATLDAVKLSRAAGRFGENLTPGTCALTHRALNAGERATIRLWDPPFTNDARYTGAHWLSNNLPFVAQCASTKRCLLWATAESVTPSGGQHWWVIRPTGSDLRMTWPDFAAMARTKNDPLPKKRKATKKKMPMKKKATPTKK